jgi:BlaI family transcriptional regulator, penicillinase repressor
MEEVWRRGEATVRDVMTALNETKRRAYTTYMTVLVRLHKKGLLERRDDNGTMVYSATISQEDYAATRAQADVQAIIQQPGDLALSEFARQVASLDPARRAALERLGGE